MKVKNVIGGLLKEYDLEEINILTDERCIFSGTFEQWKNTQKDNPDMIIYKRNIENTELKKRIMFNYRKAFLFI